jgi:hypothetical protein
MIVNRRTFNIKSGCMEDAVQLVKQETEAERERSGYSGPVRIYTSETGRFDRLAVEWEYENLAEYEQGWAGWAARPTTPAFMEKWGAVTDKGGINELWNVPD